MQKTSQTEVAVLGALSVQPMTGYALRAAIRDVLGHFWSESFGQIYPTLAGLEERGHVTRHGADRPGATTFAITDAGLARLRERLAEPVQAVPPRNGLLLRVFFGRHLGAAACRALVEEARAEAQSRLAALATLRREVEGEVANAEDRPYWLLTIAAGEHAARAALAWADDALRALQDPHHDEQGATP